MEHCKSLFLAAVALLAMVAPALGRPPAQIGGGHWVCPPGLSELITVESTLFCFEPCKPGYTRGTSTFLGNIPTCYSDCPSGFRDDGLYCAKPAAYGRGFGYALWDEDKCNSEHSDTGCERCLAMWYPKCKPGFHPVGCNVCSPDCPANQADIGVSCRKDIYDTAFEEAKWEQTS